MSKDLPAIEINGVTKTFQRRIVGGGYTTFKTQLVQKIRRSGNIEQMSRLKLDVLKGLDLKVMPGETVGVIGQNGAGKSTLLKLLTGIYKPTTGSIVHRGRISALLELGAGFHPEFSGRENIHMNGLILGLTRKELRAKEEEIIAFSELEDFIDAPVRTYSSGMYMRLAFAVAVNVDPDILIIDEVLAVGDEHFQHKSKAKLDEFKAKDIAIILVTHGLETVETWCTRAVWLDQGRIVADGDPRNVVDRYRKHVAKTEDAQRVAEAAQDAQQAPVLNQAAHFDPDAKRWGDGRVSIQKVWITDASGAETYVIPRGGDCLVHVDYTVREATEGIILGIGLMESDGKRLFGTNTQLEGTALPPFAESGTFTIRLDRVPFVSRYVQLDLAIHNVSGAYHDEWRDVLRLDFFDDKARPGVAGVDVAFSL